MQRVSGILGLQKLYKVIFYRTEHHGSTSTTGVESNAISTSQPPLEHEATDTGVLSDSMGDLRAPYRTLVLEISRLKNLRERRQLLNTQKANEMQKYLDKRRFLVESLLEVPEGAIDEAFAKLIAYLGESLPSTSRAGLRQQLEDDGDAFMNQTNSLIEIEKQVTTLESRVVDAGDNVWNVLEEVVRGLPNGETLLSEIRASTGNVQSSRSSTSELLPSPARDYFRTTADISLLRDQLFDLQSVHVQETESRQVARDQEREVVPADEVFESEHRSALEVLEQKLKGHEQLQQNLERACRTTGLDIEMLRHRRPTHDTSSYARFEAPFPLPPFVAEHIIPHSSPSTLADHPSDTQPDHPSGDLASNEDVHTWLTMIAGPEEEPELIASPAEEPGEPRCSDSHTTDSAVSIPATSALPPD